MKVIQLKGLQLFCLFWVGAGVADSDQLADKQKELADLRQRSAQYEKELQKQNRNVTTELNLLANLDKEIDLTRSYIASMNTDLNRLEEQIERRGLEITELSAEQEKLRQTIKDRMVYFYKHKRTREIELLLSVQTWQQLKAWLRFEKMIADNDRRTLQALQTRGRSLQEARSFIQVEASTKEQSLQEKRREEVQLSRSRAKRQELLSTLQKNKKLMQSRLEDIRQSEKEISKLIAKAEKARIANAKKQKKTERSERVSGSGTGVMTQSRFSDLKGRMIWPTRGTIISHFGRERHPELNTITENLGIEIKARLGSPVIAVGEGVVQTITWQRSRGNIVIISHEEGYYTVYTHLQDIQVDEMQPVKQGQTIGTVGDSGSLIGPVLHFQIWQNTINLNPEEWLA